MRNYVERVLRYRGLVIGTILLTTAMMMLQVKHLKVIIDPNTMLPQQHPYVRATNQIEEVFGSKYVILIGITPIEGDAFSPNVLGKVQRITEAILKTPGVLKGNVLSLAARRVKSIAGGEEGMQVRPMMEKIPQTADEIETLRVAVRANPAYLNAVISKDEKTATVLAEFKGGNGGFREIMDRVQAIIDREKDTTVEIHIGGSPVYLAQIERFSQRIIILFPLAVLLAGLIHLEAFRSLQGMILPLITALLAVIWGMGMMGFSKVPLDVFNVSTPILILAIAAGHAVQILKRYYEEYHRLRHLSSLPPAEINQAAIIASMVKIGPVMLTAGVATALGFFSLVTFETNTIRTFGLFTGFGILSAVILEMSFIPALRSFLRPPSAHEERRERMRNYWDRATEITAKWVIGTGRSKIYLAVLLLTLLAISGVVWLKVDNSMKSYFFHELPFQRDDRALNARLGGTNTLYLLVEGEEADAIKDPQVLQAMDETKNFLMQQPSVGKVLSLADFVKRMNQAMHGEDSSYDRIPESRELISQYLLLYSMSGQPTDFDSYVDYGYQSASIWVFLQTDSTAAVQTLVSELNRFLPTQFGKHTHVRIGGSLVQSVALNDVMVRGKIMNILQISAVIFAISAIVFRSIVAGCMVLLPLLLTTLFNFGLMGWLGIRLSVATAVISAMAIGIGADYAIYLIYRLREELDKSQNEISAMETTIVTAGKAILYVASAIAGGYSILFFSYGFYIHIWFAFLIVMAMLISALAALTLLPSLILSMRPRFIFGGKARQLAAPAGTVVGILLALSLFPAVGHSQTLSAKQIMEKNFVATRVLDSISNATFTLINKSGQKRLRKTFGTSKLQSNGIDNMRMIRFLSPPDIKGTVVLTIEHFDHDDDIWIYLPALKKVRRLVASNKKDSFVGTDFSYGDVIGYRVSEWEHRLLREEDFDGQRCYVIESIPGSDLVRQNSGYSKRVIWVHQESFVTVHVEIWDLADAPLKHYTASEIRLIDPSRGKWQPMRQEAINLQTGHRTEIRYEGFKANQNIKDEFFTTRYMEREQ